MFYTIFDKINRFLIGIVVLLMIPTVASAISKPTKNASHTRDSLSAVYRNQSYDLEEKGDYVEALHYLRMCDSLSQGDAFPETTMHSEGKQLDAKVYRMIVVLVIVDMVGLMLFFYLEKKRAYKKLVKKNIEWAGQDHPIAITSLLDVTAKIDESDDKETMMTRQLMLMFEKEKVFLDENLSIVTIAQRLNTNRNVVSKIVNTRFKKNFAALLNEYRIKEAIRMLNDETNKKYTMQAISEMCGYKNRQVFYVAFKKETGVTPTEFVKMKSSRDFEED